MRKARCLNAQHMNLRVKLKASVIHREAPAMRIGSKDVRTSEKQTR